MSRRQRYSLLIVRSDGSRVFRVNLPQRAAVVLSVCLVGCASLMGALVGDWAQLRQLTREARADRALLAEQRKTIDAISARIANLSHDAELWRELHGRIWQALGPDPSGASAVPGIGGSPRALVPKVVTGGIDRLAEVVAEEGENLRALDRLMSRAGKALAALPSRWPVVGPINSEFGRRLSPWVGTSEFHSGVDIGAKIGTPVHAAAPGTVVETGHLGDHGLTVVIDHGREIQTHYSHLSRIAVKNGQAVERGAVVGESGNTGRSTGPHLHYEVLVKGKPINPRAFLWD